MSYLKEQLAEAKLEEMTKGAIWRLLKLAEQALDFKDKTNKALQDQIKLQEAPRLPKGWAIGKGQNSGSSGDSEPILLMDGQGTARVIERGGKQQDPFFYKFAEQFLPKE